MRQFLWIFLILIILFQALILLDFSFDFLQFKEPIKVGLVYSMTGDRAINEISVQKATLLAIAEINDSGGIQGRKILPILVDVKSDNTLTINAIHDLILNDKVKTIFGSWLSSNSYSSIINFLEENDSLILTPFQTEGIIDSKNIIFLGSTINQQVPPAIYFCQKNFGNKFAFIGSDSSLSRMINLFANDLIVANGHRITADAFISPNNEESGDIDKFLSSLNTNPPDVILNALQPTQYGNFLKKLKATNFKNIPVISFSMRQTQLASEKSVSDYVGSYAVWNYFQSISSEKNKNFIQAFKNFSGLSIIDNATESAYVAVYIWKKGIESLLNIEITNIENILNGVAFQAPEGLVTMTINGNYAWRNTRIGQVNEKGQFDIVWDSSKPIRPYPYYTLRSKAEWQEILNSFSRD